MAEYKISLKSEKGIPLSLEFLGSLTEDIRASKFPHLDNTSSSNTVKAIKEVINNSRFDGKAIEKALNESPLIYDKVELFLEDENTIILTVTDRLGNKRILTVKNPIGNTVANLPGWKKYEQLREELGDTKLIKELVQTIGDKDLEKTMDEIAKKNSFKFKDSNIKKYLLDEEGDNALIEELASYLNDYYENEGLEITVEYEDGVPTLTCTNYLSDEEQDSLDEVATSWLQERLPEDRETDIYVSKDNHCFHLTLQKP